MENYLKENFIRELYDNEIRFDDTIEGLNKLNQAILDFCDNCLFKNLCDDIEEKTLNNTTLCELIRRMNYELNNEIKIIRNGDLIIETNNKEE